MELKYKRVNVSSPRLNRKVLLVRCGQSDHSAAVRWRQHRGWRMYGNTTSPVTPNTCTTRTPTLPLQMYQHVRRVNLYFSDKSVHLIAVITRNRPTFLNIKLGHGPNN